MRTRDVLALGFFVATVVIVTAAFRATRGCFDFPWWTAWNSSVPAYVIPASLSLTAAVYLFASTRSSRRVIAFAWAFAALIIGGFGILMLAAADALAACPP
jgi:hypothetical protein